MDADRVFSSGAAAQSGRGSGVPAPLDGEIILPNGRREAPRADPPHREAFAGSAPKRPGLILLSALAVSMLGLGAAGGVYAFERLNSADPAMAALAEVRHDLSMLRTGVDILKGSEEASRQGASLQSLKKSVDVLKAELELSRNADAAALDQLGAKVDKTGSDPAPKLAEITARLERIERQVSSVTPTGTIAPPAKPQPEKAPATQAVAAQNADKPLPKPTTLGNWIVRDVYDGIALVEGRSGGIREVAPGQSLPGAGEVRSIERHGRNWIVVTSRGIIDDSTW